MNRNSLLHVLDFFDEIDALIDADEGVVFDCNVIDKYTSSRQILQEQLDEINNRRT